MVNSPLTVTKHPLSWYVDRINNGQPLAFSRYGDGEFMCAMGVRGKNCDGHTYFAKMGDELLQALKLHHQEEDFIFATSPIARRLLEKEIVELLTKNGIALNAHHTGVLTESSIAGELSPFVEALSNKRVLYVGPNRLKPFILHHFATSFVDIPLENCYLKITDTLVQIYQHLDRIGYDVVAFSASMAANVMISRIWQNYYRDVSLLDLGSIWDVYATGLPTRSYMRSMEIDRLLHANFPRATNLQPQEG